MLRVTALVYITLSPDPAVPGEWRHTAPAFAQADVDYMPVMHAVVSAHIPAAALCGHCRSAAPAETIADSHCLRASSTSGGGGNAVSISWVALSCREHACRVAMAALTHGRHVAYRRMLEASNAIGPMRRVCAQCRYKAQEGDSKMLACGTCRAVHYCTAKCQRLDWARHKKYCAPPAALATPATPVGNKE